MFFNRSSEKKRGRWIVWLVPGFSVIVLCHSAAAVQPKCNLSVDSACIPNRTGFGYYQTNWRRWPEGTATPSASQPFSTTPGTPGSLPVVETPNVSEEGDVRPASPRSSGTPSTTQPAFEFPAHTQPIVPDKPPIEPLSKNSSFTLPPAPNFHPTLFQNTPSSPRRQSPNAAVAGALAAGTAAASRAGLEASHSDLVVATETPGPAATPTDTAAPESRPTRDQPLWDISSFTAAPLRELMVPPQIQSNRRVRAQQEAIQAVSATQPLTPISANPLRSSELPTTPINPLR